MLPKTNSQKIDRIADLILARESPKTDRDGYHYLYDPSHSKRPPSGYGRFFQTPKGWSTNPKYQHGALPYNVAQGLTENEIKDYVKTAPKEESKVPVSEHKQRIIQKFNPIDEGEIESIEKIPDYYASLINPDAFVVKQLGGYFAMQTKGSKKVVVSVQKEPDLNRINSVHELGHVALFHSKALEDEKFVDDTIKTMESEFLEFKQNVVNNLKVAMSNDESRALNTFESIMLNKGRGTRRPESISKTSKLLLGKWVNEISQEQLLNIGHFCDCVFSASNGTYGHGHDKNYVRSDKGNRIHEFVAHLFEDSVVPNNLLRRYFRKTATIINKKLLKKGEYEQ